MSKRHLVTPLLALLMVGAAACGSGKSSTSSSATTVAGGTGAGAVKPVTIALGGPFSGSEAPTGNQIRAGAKLAVDQLNAAGGVKAGPLKGATIALKEFDDADDPARAAANVRTMVDDSSVLAFVGSGLSDASIAAAPVASQGNFPYLAAYASSEKILSAATGAKSVFVVAPTFPAYAFSVVDELLKAGLKKPAIIHLSGTYGDGIAGLAVQRLKDKNVTAVANESFTFTDTQFGTQLAKIKAASPDSLIMVGLADSDALILKQADGLGLRIPAFDPGGITNSATFLSDAGPLAEGVVGNSPTDAARNTPAAKALRDSYTAATKESFVPDPAVFAYEGVQAVAAALADGATSRSTLVDHLHSISIADTGVGPLKFAADGSRIGGRLYIFKVKDGKPVVSTAYEQTGPAEVKEVPLDR
ncbi:MAG TPA: ABC transporter substrate-binding protein [Acidimicrobiales bacterium]|jgi:branched-chain amino acid transport system substrate-binding protein|nr:ABC transporter substrate-binding protein [Acidimicrobiales bacterium]